MGISFPRVAYNSCTGIYIQTWQKYSRNSQKTAKQWLIGAVSIVAIPILSAIDASICLALCVTIVPLIFLGKAPLLDLIASILSIALSIFQLGHLCRLNKGPPIGLREFLTGHPHPFVSQLKAELTQDEESLRQLQLEGVCNHIPMRENVSPQAISNFLESETHVAAGLKLNDLVNSIDDGVENREVDSATAKRIVKGLKLLGVSTQRLLRLSFPLFVEVVAETGFVSSLEEACRRGAQEKRDEFKKSIALIIKEEEAAFSHPKDSKIKRRTAQEKIMRLAKNSRNLEEYTPPVHRFLYLFKELHYLEHLLKQGASLTITDPQGKDPVTTLILLAEVVDKEGCLLEGYLTEDVSHKVMSKLLLLLEYGASLETSWQGYTLFEWADYCNKRTVTLKGKSDLLTFLEGWKKEATLDQITTSMKTAIQFGRAKVLERLIKRWPQTCPTNENDAHASNLLALAIQQRQVECVDVLLKERMGINCLEVVINKEAMSSAISVYANRPSQIAIDASATRREVELLATLHKHLKKYREEGSNLIAETADIPIVLANLIFEYYVPSRELG